MQKLTRELDSLMKELNLSKKSAASPEGGREQQNDSGAEVRLPLHNMAASRKITLLSQ